MLDMVAGGIHLCERTQRYEKRSGIVRGLQYDGRPAIADIDGMAEETLLFAVEDLDSISDLDRVLRESERH